MSTGRIAFTPLTSQLTVSTFLYRSIVSIFVDARRAFTDEIDAISEPKYISLETLNPFIKSMQYAVRGPLVIRAAEINKELKKGVKKPFTEVISANIGDCHAMGQKPITFIRQVLSMITYPVLLTDNRYPEDAKERARLILKSCKGGSVGSYTDSAGIEVIRRHCSDYIEQRDGAPSNWEDIVLTSGASDGIKGIMNLLIFGEDDKRPGVMVPIPQYPLYSAIITEFNMHQINYYLDECKNWGLDESELQRAFDEANKVCHPRAIVVINPGNPTGSVLSKSNIEGIIKFAYDNKLVILADEVYQHNIYTTNARFYSFKKVLMEMGSPYNKMELASFMSCSKSYTGECGMRGGYVEVINLCSRVKYMYMKMLSAGLCSNVLGQAVLECIVCPPKKGDPSHDRYMQEKTAVLEALMYRAKLVADTFNTFDGYSCNPVLGSMYAFPRIKLPPKAIEAAKEKDIPADVHYAFELLENTGICIVPGSGFGQQRGTNHIRTTILPQTDKLNQMLALLNKFHKDFLTRYT